MVSAIELGKSLSKLMIPIAPFKKFSSSTLITSIKVIYMTTHSRKPYKLINMHFIKGTMWNVTIQKGKIYYINIKVIAFIINFRGNKTVRN